MIRRLRDSTTTRFSKFVDKFDDRNIYDKVSLHPENDEIRLLYLEDDTISTQRPLRCRFKVVSLKPSGNKKEDENAATAGDIDNRTEGAWKPPTYSAVSYTWGKNPAKRTMIIDGRRVEVPVNTEIALRNLLAHKIGEASKGVKKSRVSREIFLWIDALCINQQDVQEKNHQVAMMDRVYSSAEEVLVWLGEADAGDGLRLKQLLEEVYADCARATGDFVRLRQTLYPKGGAGVSAASYGAEPSQPHIVETMLFSKEEEWNLVTKFCSLAWFKRVWIIQEIALASRATLHWGETAVPWHVASVAIRWIYYGRLKMDFLRSEPLTMASARTVRNMENAVELYDRSAQARSNFPGAYQSEGDLNSVLWASTNFHATDPRDNIFALLGLLSPRSREACAALAPDYSSNLATVYTAAARALLEQNRCVAFINQAGLHQAFQSGTEPLPSWVPHWDQAGRGQKGSCRQLWVTINSSTFTPQLALRELPGLPHILSVKGISVDTVDRLGPSFSVPGSTADSDETTRIETVQQLARQVTRAHHFARESSLRDAQYLSGYKQAFLMTLFCGRTAHLEPAEKDPDFFAASEAFLKCFETLQADTIIPVSIARLFHPLNAFCHNRTFFVTSEGRFGMAPPGTREGDHIVFLFSHSWPFVLRQVDEYWVLLGDVYVDGLMSGSYWRELAQEDAVWMDIH